MSERIETLTGGEEMTLPLTHEQLNVLSDDDLLLIAVKSFGRIVNQHGRDVEPGFAVRHIEEETGVGNDVATLVVAASAR